jgi:polyisoprenyl-phosphate glycosyltransferase
MSTTWPSNLIIMMPVFNDWQAVSQLLLRLDAVLLENKIEASILLVNDASIDPMPESFREIPRTSIQQIHLLSLRRNVGNQRAIAIGVAHVQQHLDCQALVIMDGDGEDDPNDVPRLFKAMEANGERKVVFAARMKRSESLWFLICYHLYRLVHWMLTGIAVRVGNFSIVPAAHLKRLVLLSEMWNHYAAAVFKSRIPYETVPTHRAPRLAGRSRMNFVSLVTHGLSAISVFSELVGVRLLLLTGLFSTLTFLGLAGVLLTAMVTGATIPPWGYQVMALLTVLLVQCLVLGVVFVMVILNGRSGANFLPVRDYAFFVDEAQVLYQMPLTQEEEAHVAERKNPRRLAV